MPSNTRIARTDDIYIRLYGYPGCHVLDPFAGSGSTGVAVARLNKATAVNFPATWATLVDIDAGYCELARRRCADGLG